MCSHSHISHMPKPLLLPTQVSSNTSGSQKVRYKSATWERAPKTSKTGQNEIWFQSNPPTHSLWKCFELSLLVWSTMSWLVYEICSRNQVALLCFFILDLNFARVVACLIFAGRLFQILAAAGRYRSLTCWRQMLGFVWFRRYFFGLGNAFEMGKRLLILLIQRGF